MELTKNIGEGVSITINIDDKVIGTIMAETLVKSLNITKIGTTRLSATVERNIDPQDPKRWFNKKCLKCGKSLNSAVYRREHEAHCKGIRRYEHRPTPRISNSARLHKSKLMGERNRLAHAYMTEHPGATRSEAFKAVSQNTK